MERDTLISVVVPVYNVEAYLRRCVDSIRNQTCRNLEIILVDDGAMDASGAICDELAGEDSRIRVIHKENGGLSSARNAGIDVATGEYLQFVDSDDWLAPETSEVLLDTARKHHVELVCAGRWDVNADTGEKTVGLCPPREEVISTGELVSRIFRWDQCDSSACDKLFHRRLFAALRFPLGVVSEDVPVMYRIVLETDRAAMLDKPLYHYFHRHGSITGTKLSEKTFHFTQHTREILDWITRNRPELLPEARYLRVRSLMYCVQAVDLTDREKAKPFAQICRTLRRELRSYTGFFLTSPLFCRRERAVNLLLALGLYRSLRGLRHRGE